jgi:glucosyl-dolichyl phosphate glucuronosyltransferase
MNLSEREDYMPDTPIHISVIICTRNREASLGRALNSLLTTDNLRKEDWELLVVIDRNSTDRTNGIAQEFAERFPSHVRLLVQPNTGKSDALNAGIRAACGDVLAFTDDDCLCDEGYLPGTRAVFSDPAVHAVAARQLVNIDGEPPRWLPKRQPPPWLRMRLGECDRGETFCELPSGKVLFGSNMLVRRQVFARVGGFRPDLGPGGTGMAEDKDVSLRITAAGYRLHYAPQILIRHQLAAGRLTRRFFVVRIYRDGVSGAHVFPFNSLHPRWNPRLPTWVGWLYGVKRTIVIAWRAARLHFTGQPAEAVCVVMEHAGWLGSVIEYGRMRRLGITEFPVPRPLDDAGRPVEETVLPPASHQLAL